jgi:hypothetical protein
MKKSMGEGDIIIEKKQPEDGKSSGEVVVKKDSKYKRRNPSDFEYNKPNLMKLPCIINPQTKMIK